MLKKNKKYNIAIGSEDFDKDFYKDVDKLKQKNCCSLRAIYLVLFLIFIVLVFSFIYAKNHFHFGLGSAGIENPSVNLSAGINGEIENQIKDTKLGEEATVNITEAELAAFLGVGESDFPLKNSSLKMSPSGIEIKGKTKASIFSLPVTVVAQPKVENGKLKVELDTVSSSYVTLPKTVKDGLSDYINDLINNKTSNISDLELKQVVLKNGSMDLIGTKKNAGE